MLRVGLYLRISHDPDGTQTATARQRQDCEAWAERNEATIADVFEDVDLSAYQRKVRRPEFERLLEAVRGGKVDGVLAWKIDRVARQMRDLVRLMEACDDAKVFLVTLADGIDTRTSMGRTVAELFTSMAHMESRNISLRLSRRVLADAKEGKPHAGGRRPFGYTAGKNRHIIPEEAAAIREAVTLITEHGVALQTIARDWYQRGILSPKGLPWRSSGIRSMLLAAHHTGRRTHLGVVHDTVSWEPILTDDQAARLAVALRIRRPQPRGRQPKLLTGLLYCGRCGYALTHDKAYGNGKGLYRCKLRIGSDRCGRVSCRADRAEAAILDLVSLFLDSGAFAAARASKQPPQRDVLLSELAADEAALEELTSDFYVHRAIGRQEFFGARGQLTERIEQKRQALAYMQPEQTLPSTGQEFKEMFEAAPLHRQRDLLRLFIARVDVAPADGSPSFVSRLSETWRV